MIDFSAAYAGITYAKEALKFTLDQKVDDKVREKVSEALEKIGKVQDDLFMVREDLLRLQEENHQLKEEMREKESWENKISKYMLSDTVGGAVVYLYLGSPVHYACPACVAKKEIQILQDRRVLSGKFDCPSCKAEYPINAKEKMNPITF